MLPGTLVYVNAGTQLAAIRSVSDILSPGLIGSFVLLGLFPLIAKWLLGMVKRRRIYRPVEAASGGSTAIWWSSAPALAASSPPISPPPCAPR